MFFQNPRTSNAETKVKRDKLTCTNSSQKNSSRSFQGHGGKASAGLYPQDVAKRGNKRAPREILHNDVVAACNWHYSAAAAGGYRQCNASRVSGKNPTQPSAAHSWSKMQPRDQSNNEEEPGPHRIHDAELSRFRGADSGSGQTGSKA